MIKNYLGVFLKFGLVVFFAFQVVVSVAQKKVNVTATGSYTALDLTIEEVKNKAIEEAKRNAMIKAGISENIKVSDFMYTFESDNKFQDIFQSFVSTETGAEIIVENIRETKRDINQFGNIMVEVEIDATVIKHKEKKDPAFNIKVDGIRDSYYENDPLNFSVIPTRDGYLKIFNVFDSDNVTLLYPLSDNENKYLVDDPGRLFKKNIEERFPINKNIDSYYFEILDPNASEEYNLLIFVFTKVDYPYHDEVTVPNIMKWLFNIPPDQRAIVQYGILLKR